MTNVCWKKLCFKKAALVLKINLTFSFKHEKHSFFDKLVFSFKKTTFNLKQIVFSLKTRSKFPWWPSSVIKQSIPSSLAKECHIDLNTNSSNYSPKLSHPRDHSSRSIAFHQTNFLNCTVNDKGPHHRCCYLEKHVRTQIYFKRISPQTFS